MAARLEAAAKAADRTKEHQTQVESLRQQKEEAAQEAATLERAAAVLAQGVGADIPALAAPLLSQLTSAHEAEMKMVSSFSPTEAHTGVLFPLQPR